jgi:hypothetical protein
MSLNRRHIGHSDNARDRGTGDDEHRSLAFLGKTLGSGLEPVQWVTALVQQPAIAEQDLNSIDERSTPPRYRRE